MMGLVLKAVLLAAAGAAGWMLAKRKKVQEAPSGTEKVVYLGEDDAVIDPERPPVPAEVKNCYRRMDPLSLNSGNEAIFLLEDGSEVKLSFSGEGGLYLAAGDKGLLSWQGMRLLRFEREDGAVFGGSFYVPAGEGSADE